MALWQQLLLCPSRGHGGVGVGQVGAESSMCSSATLSSAFHVGSGGDHPKGLHLTRLFHSRAGAASGVLERRGHCAENVGRQSELFGVVAVSLNPVEEDEVTRGPPRWRERNSSGEDRSRNASTSQGQYGRNGRGRDFRGSENGPMSRNTYDRGQKEISRSESRRDSLNYDSRGRGDSGGDRGRRFSDNASPSRGDYGEERQFSRSNSGRGRGGDSRSQTFFGRDGGGSQSSFGRDGGRSQSSFGRDGGGDQGRKVHDNVLPFSASNSGYGPTPGSSRGNANSGQYPSFRKYPSKVDKGRSGQNTMDSRGNSPKKSNSKTPYFSSQVITPKQTTFVSDRAVHRAPWEQGRSNANTFPARDVLKNPLVERLQKIQEEAEYESEDEWDDSVEDDEATLRAAEDSDDDDSYFEEKGVKSAMSRIVEKLNSLQGSGRIYRAKDSQDATDSLFTPKNREPMIPTAGPGWGTPDHPVAIPAALSVQKNRPDTRFPWEREADKVVEETHVKLVRVKPPSLAELTVPEDELKRLRSLGILARHRVKIGRLGVTNGIVESIHNEWKNSEVVRVKCEGPPAQNMKRTHEQLEERTGGLVVWRAGGACLVYRGKDYVPPSERGLLDVSKIISGNVSAESVVEADEVGEDESGEFEEGSDRQIVARRIVVPRVKSVYDPELEQEVENILSDLGPRYEDWTGANPIPIDADLLVGSKETYRKPYRLLPFGVRASLSNIELTNLRRLARPIPPHFVLGLNRNLEGLAESITKLWAKSEIVKIAVKRGVQNTNHERMGEQLKRLTGGVLLSRDKFFIVLYRGKDFLPPDVAAVLEERQSKAAELLSEEERLRSLPSPSIRNVLGTSVEKVIAGTLSETLEAKANWEELHSSEQMQRSMLEARESARKDMMRRIQKKISVANFKRKKAEADLEKVEKRLRPAGPPSDRENITDEERHMYSKLGLKMHAFLLLGRRGIFDGTVENMHLHWKHRELVKVIYKARDKIDLEQTARMLEYESGGILVATIATNKGQAIIVYRGKNYQRPPQLRPPTLLTKRQALKRSLEMQRYQALTLHVMDLEAEVKRMQADLDQLEAESGQSDMTADMERMEADLTRSEDTTSGTTAEIERMEAGLSRLDDEISLMTGDGSGDFVDEQTFDHATGGIRQSRAGKSLNDFNESYGEEDEEDDEDDEEDDSEDEFDEDGTSSFHESDWDDEDDEWEEIDEVDDDDDGDSYSPSAVDLQGLSKEEANNLNLAGKGR